MEIHKPKPWRGFREFLKEYGIIVLGVLTALAAEQAVERMHWAHAVERARVSLKSEMGRANQFFAFRVAASSCVNRRIDSLDAILERAAAHKPVPKLGPVGPDIGNGLSDSEWQAQRASQTLTHFDEKELDLLGGYYHQLDSLADLVFREDADWDDLRVLQGDPARLGPEDFAGLRRSLQHARFDNYLIGMISDEQLDRAKALGMTAPKVNQARLANICAAQSTRP